MGAWSRRTGKRGNSVGIGLREGSATLIISIMRPAYFLIILLGTLVAASASLDLRWLTDSQQWMRSLIGNEAATFKAGEAEAKIATQVSAVRRAAHQEELASDAELRDWLGGRVGKGAMDDLDDLTASVRAQFPRYVKLAVCALKSPSVDDLLQKASDWSHQTEKSFTHQAVVARARAAHFGFECVIVTGQRLEDFDPGKLARGHDHFFVKCPLCHSAQGCEIPPLMRSVSLECPSCHRPYAMLAVDTKGRYRYVNEYLEGYAPPARFPGGISKLNEMLLIWNSVVHGIRYVPDLADGNDTNDAWQTAAETQRLGTGDCEDSSIYLADWLISRGFNARVAVGHYAERGGHAWVIVRLDGRSYILESTNPEVDTHEPPLLENVGARYVPDAMIDREGFYTRLNPSAPWDGDYWSLAKWQHVLPNRKETIASAKGGATP